MLDQLRSLSENFHTTDLLLSLSTADLNADTSTHPSRHTEGPSIHWQIEHMLAARLRVLRLLDRPQPEASLANLGLGQLLDHWNSTATALQTALENASSATLDKETRGGPHGDTTVFGLINFLSWHEAYHFGGLGSTRKVLGLTEVADLARAHYNAQHAPTESPQIAIAS